MGTPMGTVYRWAILICTLAAIIAELTTLLFPGAVLSLMDHDAEEMVGDWRFRLLGWLSLVYLIDIGLLLFSGDAIFQAYAGILVGLAVVLWLAHRWGRSMRYLLMAESAVCLTLLIDVARTILKMEGLVSA